MKKVTQYTVLALVAVAVASIINWSYIYKLLDLEKQSINEMFEGTDHTSKVLDAELETITVEKLVNPKVMVLLDLLLQNGDDDTNPPPADPVPTAWPDYGSDEIREKMKTDPNTAFFWSGTTTDKNGKEYGGEKDAAAIAESRGGVTLEIVLKRNGIVLPEWDENNPIVVKAWEDISAAYADQVSGEVWAVVGRDLRVDNAWENVEYPRLMKNPNVTKITLIEPYTMEEKVLFER